MRLRRILTAFLVGALTGCTGTNGPATPASPDPSAAKPVARQASPAPAVLIGAGDIASCDGTGDSRTLAVLQRFPGTVFTLGDNAYPDGSRSNFTKCFGPTWGR